MRGDTGVESGDEGGDRRVAPPANAARPRRRRFDRDDPSGTLPQRVRGVGRGDSRVRRGLAEQSEKLSERDLVGIQSIDGRAGRLSRAAAAPVAPPESAVDAGARRGGMPSR